MVPSFYYTSIGINKILSDEGNPSRSRVIKKFSKTYPKAPKLRHTISNKPENHYEKFLRNIASNETTEDSKHTFMTTTCKIRINSPLSQTEIPRTFSGLQTNCNKVNKKSNSKVIRNVKSSWGLHESCESNGDCLKCGKLIQIINEKDVIIEEMKKEKQRLEQKITTLMRIPAKVLELKKNPPSQHNQSTKFRNLILILI